jgi:hypothetical protein
MSAGKGTRWNSYMNISKQEVVINNENLLQRMVRQINLFDDNPNIIISSSNKNHYVDNCKLYLSENENTYKKRFVYENINEPTIYLYGVTFYSDEIIKKIILTSTDNVLFFGNENAIIAIKVFDFKLFKTKLDNYKGGKSLLHEYKEHDLQNLFIHVGYDFKNINTSNDYNSLIKEKTLIKK